MLKLNYEIIIFCMCNKRQFAKKKGHEKMEFKNGFYTALGTHLDENGNLVEASLRKHINQQIEAGASGILLMGSMGIEAYIKNSAYAEIVRVAVDEVAGRLPLFVGAMDNSIVKVKEKIDMIKGAKIDV